MKVCAKCKVNKPKSEYHPRPSKKAGVRSRCKNCEKEDRELSSGDAKEYRDGRKEAKKEYDIEYRKKHKEKIAKAKKEEYSNNSDRYNEYRRQWAIANPENESAIRRNAAGKRKQSTSGGLTSTQLRAWAKSQIMDCYWCGKKKLMNYEIDHYEPLARGGEHSLDNLVISCPSCNRRKHSKDPYEFAMTKGKLF